jgi:hypothetical protein
MHGGVAIRYEISFNLWRPLGLGKLSRGIRFSHYLALVSWFLGSTTFFLNGDYPLVLYICIERECVYVLK